VQQASGISFGAGHIMDILRGKQTEKVSQYGHERLSTFGIAKEAGESELRAVLRQLIAIGAVAVDGQAFNTLRLTEGSRAVLKGDVKVQLRESVAAAPAKRSRRGTVAAPAAQELGVDDQVRFINLKAWRAEVAREHNLPAYVIFHDATLAEIARRRPQTLDDLQGISGIGAKKLEAYGADVLRVVADGE
jgi:ATP-dependent DNA helicase RecQ